MVFFEWEDRFSVGVPVIDRQHQRLIQLINQLHDSIERSNNLATRECVLTELETVTGVLNQLVE